MMDSWLIRGHGQCFHKSSMKFPFLSIKFPFFPLIFLAKITKFPFKFPSYSETSPRRLWRRLRINNLYSGASSLMRLCLKCKDVEHIWYHNVLTLKPQLKNSSITISYEEQ
jgi:hypothetical protein